MPKPNNVPNRAVAKAVRQQEAAERRAIYDALPQSEKDARNPRKAQTTTQTQETQT